MLFFWGGRGKLRSCYILKIFQFLAESVCVCVCEQENKEDIPMIKSQIVWCWINLTIYVFGYLNDFNFISDENNGFYHKCTDLN